MFTREIRTHEDEFCNGSKTTNPVCFREVATANLFFNVEYITHFGGVGIFTEKYIY